MEKKSCDLDGERTAKFTQQYAPQLGPSLPLEKMAVFSSPLALLSDKGTP
jgi:hypothetical protein